jgi:hypothetical protein
VRIFLPVDRSTEGTVSGYAHRMSKMDVEIHETVPYGHAQLAVGVYLYFPT